MKDKKLIELRTRRIIRENIKFGLFKGKVKKDFELLLNDFRTTASHSVEINELISQLQKIKHFVETKLKGKYTDIFVEADCDWLNSNFGNIDKYYTIILGRLETDEELNKRLTEQEEYNRNADEEQLKSDAKTYLHLKKKFENKK